MPSRPRAIPDSLANPGTWIERFGLLWLLALVGARATFQEVMRDPLEVLPGAAAAPRGAGPGATLVLNLLACAPALALLMRDALRRDGSAKSSWACRIAALLCGWMALSAIWADDKFAALVGATTFAAAMAVVWSFMRCVRTWADVRLVAGWAFGILLVLVAHGLHHRFVDTPDLRRDWQERREQILGERGMEPGSFAAQQFEKRVLADQLMGFTASPNSFAAALVMLSVVAIGLAVQRRADGDAWGWIVPITLTLIGAAWAIVMTSSRTALATPILAVAALGGIYFLRGWLARRAGLAYALGLAAVLLALAAIIAHGLARGSLFHISLTFRWLYWVGAARVFLTHPFLGVGWGNFGAHYLAHRVPFPPEEIRDPHNFIVRFFAELGIIGGLLLVAWMGRLWWEMTRPSSLPPDARREWSMRSIVIIAGLAMAVNIFASVDFQQAGAYVLLEFITRAVGLGLLIVGPLAASAASTERAAIISRPAPWILYTIVLGAGLFLLHNLIDFSLFEAGPMFLFSMLVGAALGARRMAAPRSSFRALPRILLAGGLAAFLAGCVLAVRVLAARDAAAGGDDDIRAGQPASAARELGRAFALLPIDADLAFREARALLLAGAPAARVDQALAAAIAADPSDPAYPATRARLWLRQPSPPADRVRQDFEQALVLDPRNVSLRLEYAQGLEDLALPALALEQYKRALDFDEQMPPEEEKRLASDKAREVREKIRSLSQRTTTAPAAAPGGR